MRVIDSDAINKRVLADIANTFQHSSKITGEKTVQNLSGTDDPKAAAADNFNFNGIEFSKIKQLINYVQTHKKEIKFDEQLVEITNNKEETLNYFVTPDEGKADEDSEGNVTANVKINKKGVIINDYKKQFVVPDSFDGRNSFVIPSFALVPKMTDIKYDGTFYDITVSPDEHAIGQREDINVTLGAAGHTWDYENMYDALYYLPSANLVLDLVSKEEHSPVFYKPNLIKSMKFGLTEKRNVFDHKEFVKCWAASMDDSDGNNCMIIDKTREKITITASLNLSNKNFGFDRSGSSGTKLANRRNEMNVADFMRDNCIDKVYLHVLFMYWRDK